MSQKKYSCSCHCKHAKVPEYQIVAGKEITLADLPVGSSATIARVMPNMRGQKKFADVGMVAGTELSMEAHAPFGGLLRVKVMESSMALHRDDAANIVMKKDGRK